MADTSGKKTLGRQVFGTVMFLLGAVTLINVYFHYLAIGTDGSEFKFPMETVIFFGILPIAAGIYVFLRTLKYTPLKAQRKIEKAIYDYAKFHNGSINIKAIAQISAATEPEIIGECERLAEGPAVRKNSDGTYTFRMFAAEE